MATLAEINLHWNSLRLMVVFESPKSLMSYQCLCGTARPDSSYIFNQVWIRNQLGEMQRICALIDWGTRTIVMSPPFLNGLGISHEPANITNHGLDGQVSTHGRESRKMARMV